MPVTERSLGPCCSCGFIGPMVRNILCLPQKSPYPGKGWGCVVCGLPPDGAVAVVCDSCVELKRPLRWACRGSPATDGRVKIENLTGLHEHDMRLHPGENTLPDA